MKDKYFFYIIDHTNCGHYEATMRGAICNHTQMSKKVSAIQKNQANIPPCVCFHYLDRSLKQNEVIQKTYTRAKIAIYISIIGSIIIPISIFLAKNAAICSKNYKELNIKYIEIKNKYDKLSNDIEKIKIMNEKGHPKK